MTDVWEIAKESEARWIFPAREEGAVNQYVDFLHVFECEAPSGDSQLRISADTDFVVWLNGKLVGDGQYSNYPSEKTFERFELGGLLKAGSNSLAVTAFYNGRPSSVYDRGAPGVVFSLHQGAEILAASGVETLCRENPCYHSGSIAIVSGQLAYTFGYDARGEDAFYVDGSRRGSEWRWILESESAVPAGRENLGVRPVPRLVPAGVTSARLIECGRFRYDATLAESGFGAEEVEQSAAGLMMTEGAPVSPAWQMQNALLSPVETGELLGVEQGFRLNDLDNELDVDVDDLDGRDGIYLVFDMGQQEVGHVEIQIEAAEGTIVDMGYGEHLDDGRVRTFISGRNFGARYICGVDSRVFKHHYLRWAGRYLQLYVHGRKFKLHKFGLFRCNYPVGEAAQLDTGKELHSDILNVGVRTLRLCMHEHYEDTPWREQALYANDARTQALCGYYAFGETRMPRASFELLGKSLRKDGFLNLTAPARTGLTIPSFTFAWMLAVRDYHLYSGDDSLSRKFMPQISSMLNAFLDERKEGLLPLRRVKGIWHFYDWSAGMSGYSNEEFEDGLDADAPLNCFLILALDAANQVLGWLAEPEDNQFDDAAEELRSGVAERFWSAGDSAFRTSEHRKRLTELTQALAILAGVGDDGIRSATLDRLGSSDSGLSESGLSQLFYVFEAMMSEESKYGKRVLSRIEDTWGMMVDAGATTFWETVTGASDFNNAGSLCHGWSAVPVYFLYHDVLGLKPLEPGFRKFAVDPVKQGLSSCKGKVPTPKGEVAVSWQSSGDGSLACEVSVPDGLTCIKKG